MNEQPHDVPFQTRSNQGAAANSRPAFPRNRLGSFMVSFPLHRGRRRLWLSLGRSADSSHEGKLRGLLIGDGCRQSIVII